MTSKKSKAEDDTKKRILVNYAGDVLIGGKLFCFCLDPVAFDLETFAAGDRCTCCFVDFHKYRIVDQYAVIKRTVVVHIRNVNNSALREIKFVDNFPAVFFYECTDTVFICRFVECAGIESLS